MSRPTQHQEEEDLHGTSDSILAALDSGCDGDPPADGADEGPADGDFLDLFDPGSFGYSASDVLVGLVGTEESDDLAPDSLDQLADAAARSLSHSRKGSRKKSELISFDEDDFEGAQRDAFILIRDYKNLLFNKATKPKDHWEAIDWFFTIVDDGTKATFDLACRAFGARVDVVRLRIMYEFFLRWIVIPTDFPFETVPVPEIIGAEIAFLTGDAGQELARIAWNRPGITTNELLALAGDTKPTRDALMLLDDKFILCLQGEDNWYLTGRNPALMRQRLIQSKGREHQQGGSIHWSRLL